MKTISPKVGVLVLNWNGLKVLDDCLKSLTKINYENHRVIVIDNGSTDGSICSAMKTYNKMEFLRFQKNYGYSAGYNKAFELLQDRDFDCYVLLNNDTAVEKNFLSLLVKAYQDIGDQHIYGPRIMYQNNKSKIWFAGGVINLPLTIKHRGIRESLSAKFLRIKNVDYITGCCLLIGKKTLENLSGFDERFEMYCEDVDLCLRARSQGVKSIYVGESFIYHKVSSSIGGQFSIDKILKKIKSHIFLLKKSKLNNY